MAKSPEAIGLQTIQAVENVQDIYLKELERVYRELSARITAYLKDAELVGSSVTSGETTAAIDSALAMQDIEKILIDSGYYEVTGNMFSNGYNEIIDLAKKEYEAIYSINLQYSDSALSMLNSSRLISTESYLQLGEKFKTAMAKEVSNLSYGLTSLEQSASVLADTLSITQVQAETLTHTVLSDVHRTASGLLGDELGVEKYEYYGPEDKITRPTCRHWLDVRFGTKDFWISQQNGQNGNAWTSGGGWNCRHRLIPVSPI